MESREKRRSFFLSLANRIGTRIGAACRKSRILRYLSSLDARLQTAESKSAILHGSERSPHSSSKVFVFCLLAGEKSLFLRFLQGIFDFLLQTTVHTYGVFFLLYGGLGMLFSFLGNTGSGLSSGLICVLLSVPMLLREGSLAEQLAKSTLVGAFGKFLGIPLRSAIPKREGGSHFFLAFFTACILSVLGWKTGIPILLCIGTFLLLCLIFYLPELLLILMLLCFPVFPLLPHPTLILLALALILELAWLWKVLCGRREVKMGLTDGVALLFAGLTFLSGIGSPGGRASFFYATVSAVFVLIYFPARSLLSRLHWRRNAQISLQFGGLFCSFFGIWQHYFANLPLLWTDQERFSELGGRVTASFSNPNILSVYLLFLLPQALALCLQKECPLRSRFFFGICFFAEALCLLFTFTRGAWLGAIFGCFAVLLLLSPLSRGGMLLFFPSIALLLPLLPTRILHRFPGASSFLDSSVRYRLYTWKGSMRMIRAHPFGIGAGEASFVTTYPHYALSGTEGVMHTHQIFLQIQAELGVFGSICFLVLLLLVGLRVMNGCRSRKTDTRVLLIGSGSALLAVLVMGLFDHIWYFSGMIFLFWVTIAALQVAGTEEKEDAWDTNRRQKTGCSCPSWIGF